MNQQRGRRFKAAQEISKGRERKEKLAEVWKKEGIDVPNEWVNKKSWDYNVITPGTEFMEKCATFLKKYIVTRLANHRKWKGLSIIFSDSNVPGEGEHKILDFIRRQRQQPNYDVNTRHCLYGADADLIMLG